MSMKFCENKLSPNRNKFHNVVIVDFGTIARLNKECIVKICNGEEDFDRILN